MEKCCPSGLTRVCYRVYPVRSRLTFGYTGRYNYSPNLGFQTAFYYDFYALITSYTIDIDSTGNGTVTVFLDREGRIGGSNPEVMDFRSRNVIDFRLQEDNISISLGRSNDDTISRDWQIMDVDTPGDDFSFAIETLDYLTGLAQKITALIQVIALLPPLLELQPFLLRLQATLAEARIGLERIKAFTRYERCIVIDDSGTNQHIAIRLMKYDLAYNDILEEYTWRFLGQLFDQPIRAIYSPYGRTDYRIKCCPSTGCGDDATCEDCPDGTVVSCDSNGFRCCYGYDGKVIKTIKI